MKITDVAVSHAFNGSVPGAEKNAGVITGYQGMEDHPSMPKLIPQYRFNIDKFMTLCYAWMREWTRAETAPRRGIWFGGPKAAGKTTIVEQFFGRLGVPVTSLTCNRRIPLSDFTFKMVPDGEGGWNNVPGALVLAMQGGYPVVLNEPSAMDEADLIAMHDIIDRGILVTDTGDVIQAKKGFMVFATDNTMGYGDDTGAYGGTNTMNSATMRRFFKETVDYPEAGEELEILKGYYPGQPEEALTAFVTFANMMREPYRKGMTSVTMGTGEIVEWVECTAYFDGLSRSPTKKRSPAWFAFQRIMGGIPAVDMQNARANFQAAFNYDVTGE